MQDQLTHDPMLNTAFERMAKFLSLVYVPAWLGAPQTADAPHNDAALFNQLQAYRQVDEQVAGAAIKVMKRHTWYLAPETVIFALCSGRVTDTVKGAMASKLLETPRSEEHAVGGNMPVILSGGRVGRHSVAPARPQ